MSWKPLSGKKVAVLTEHERTPEEMDYYRIGFEVLGAEVECMTNLGGQRERMLVADVTDPAVPRTMNVSVDVAGCRADDYAIVIRSANCTAVRLREIPPLGTPEETRNVPAVRFSAEAMRNRAIVKGAMCHALWILTPYPAIATSTSTTGCARCSRTTPLSQRTKIAFVRTTGWTGPTSARSRCLPRKPISTSWESTICGSSKGTS